MYRDLCCAVGPVIPPPTPTPAHGAHCPQAPFGRFAAASASGESAYGAAPSALAAPPRQCPARFNPVLCRVYIPLSTFPNLLSVQRLSALPACQIAGDY
jgi:hypothetical protein